jgi:hypothetical protein
MLLFDLLYGCKCDFEGARTDVHLLFFPQIIAMHSYALLVIAIFNFWQEIVYDHVNEII